MKNHDNTFETIQRTCRIPGSGARQYLSRTVQYATVQYCPAPTFRTRRSNAGSGGPSWCYEFFRLLQYQEIVDDMRYSDPFNDTTLHSRHSSPTRMVGWIRPFRESGPRPYPLPLRDKKIPIHIADSALLVPFFVYPINPRMRTSGVSGVWIPSGFL